MPEDGPPSGGPERTARSPEAQLSERNRRLLQRLREGPTDATPKESLDAAMSRKERETDLKLRELYAKRILRVLVAQLLIADAGFFLYAWQGRDWAVEVAVMHSWLAATVVEVIGIALVVTRYLFPRRDQSSG